MSRYSGCWVGFKAISETIETTSSFEIDPMAIEIRVPDNQQVLAGSLSIRWPDPPMEQEARLLRDKLQAVLEYVRLNGLNRQEWKVPNAKLGIVTTGKSYLDTREALSLLGIDEAGAKSLGLRVLKIGVTWPLEPDCVTEFAQGWTRSSSWKRSEVCSSRRSRNSCTTRPPIPARALSARRMVGGNGSDRRTVLAASERRTHPGADRQGHCAAPAAGARRWRTAAVGDSSSGGRRLRGGPRVRAQVEQLDHVVRGPLGRAFHQKLQAPLPLVRLVLRPHCPCA